MKKIIILIAALGITTIQTGFSATLKDLGNLKPPFELAPLPYPAGSLAPAIDQKTMEIHHAKHHKAYVDNLNKIVGSDKDRKDLKTILGRLKGKEDGLRNNAGGHWNHSFFWSLLSGNKSKNVMPERLTKELEKVYGSIDSFKEQFEKAGTAQFGSGWVWLIRGNDKKLSIVSTPNQDNPLMDVALVKGTPVLAVDVWEHAYYLNYQNMRADYLKAIWGITNWVQVNDYDLEALK